MASDIEFIEPWYEVGELEAQPLEAEFHRELARTHPLYGLRVSAWARRADTDDVLFAVEDGSDRVAAVHLTWRGSVERSPGCPYTEFYDSIEHWLREGMTSDS